LQLEHLLIFIFEKNQIFLILLVTSKNTRTLHRDKKKYAYALMAEGIGDETGPPGKVQMLSYAYCVNVISFQSSLGTREQREGGHNFLS
jgi:hypothetical protein